MEILIVKNPFSNNAEQSLLISMVNKTSQQ